MTVVSTITVPLGFAPRTLPLAHQARHLARSLDAPAWALMMDPGTGKTWIALQTLAHWYFAHNLVAALVVAPNGVHENWDEETEKHMSEVLPRRVMVWRAGKRTKIEKTLLEWDAEATECRKNGAIPPLQILLFNIESLSHKSGEKVAEQFLRAARRHGQTALIVDESHKAKSPRASRTKAVLRLSTRAALRRIMSGSAWAHGVEDLYAQYRVLDPTILGHSTYTGFKGEFCIEQRFARFSRIVGYRNIEVLKARMAPVTSYALLEECVDLPPVQGGLTGPSPMIIKVDMLPEQAAAYRSLVRLYMAELDDGSVVTADDVMTRFLRLQQITGGGVKDDLGDFHYFPTSKIAPTVDLIEATPPGTKVLVWCRFRHESEVLTRELNAAGIRTLEHSGTFSQTERKGIREQWASDPAITAMVATLSTGGTGFTLNEATLSIFVSNGFSYDDRKQAERRNLRIGQKKPIMYWDVQCRGTIDEYIFRVLRSRQSLDQLFRMKPLETFRQLLNEGVPE